VAPRVAELMAEERDLPPSWVDDQVEAFTEVARNYLMPSIPA
jgi:glycerol-3-phosphate dehydrogenase